MRNCMRAEEDCNQIVEVWSDNLEDEFCRIREVVEDYPYVALDTEFPGVVAKPSDTAGPEYNYRTVKCNVDLLKVIQLGITFADASGNIAKNPSTWQFNFRFDMASDMYAQDSIDFLRESGVDFEKLQRNGVEFEDFGALMISSGLVMNDDVKWISFHGCYDFCYLLKLLTCQRLPDSEECFFDLLSDFFPALYDIKFLLKSSKASHMMGGNSLQRLAEHFNVRRIGRQHQAGSDSLVTCRTFFRLVDAYFGNQLDDSRYSGVIYGLGFVGNKRTVEQDDGQHHEVAEFSNKQRHKLVHEKGYRDAKPHEGGMSSDHSNRNGLNGSIYTSSMKETRKFDDDSQMGNSEVKVFAR